MQANHNLSTLRILYIIKAIITFISAFVILFYTFIIQIFTTSIEKDSKLNILQLDFGSFFIVIGFIAFLFIIAFGILNLMVAKYIKNRAKHTFILVIAILNCFTGILGILLGVFTIIELSKPEIKTMFD